MDDNRSEDIGGVEGGGGEEEEKEDYVFLLLLLLYLEDNIHDEKNWEAFQCNVCQSFMNRGEKDHLCSMNHWKKLWSLLPDPPPPTESVKGLRS